LETLVRRCPQLQLRDALYAGIRLCKPAEAEHCDENEQGDDTGEPDEQLCSELERRPADSPHERIVGPGVHRPLLVDRRTSDRLGLHCHHL
jgi:hypothetical protein